MRKRSAGLGLGAILLAVASLARAEDTETRYAGNEPVADNLPPAAKPGRDPLDAVCHSAAKHCRCPAFTGFAEDGFIGRARLLATGSFSAPATKEALVVIFLCEAHASNFGGTALVRLSPDGWQVTGYVRAFVPSTCAARRGPDGVDRLACFEGYAYNQGTYSTAASVVDFAAGTYDTLSFAMCADARDVGGVRWQGAPRSGWDVAVTIRHGMRRDADLDGCRTVGGKPVTSIATFTLGVDGYAPTARSQALLWNLAGPEDANSKLDPAVAAAVRHPARTLPEGLAPKRERLVVQDVF